MLRTLLAGVALCTTTLASTSTVGFDAVSAPAAFSQIVPGLANGPHLEYASGVTLDGGVILIDLLFDDAATSGDNILATCDTCTLGDHPPTGLPGSIVMTFDPPVDRVALDVINGSGASAATFTLTGHDAGGVLLGSASVGTGPAGGPNSAASMELEADELVTVVVTTDLPTGYSFAIDTLVFTTDLGSWTDLGQGLAGSLPAPVLSGLGDLVEGSTNRLRLTGGVPDATAFVVLGLSSWNVPFKGGVLVPALDWQPVALATDGQGGFVLPFVWPAGVPGGSSFYTQAWQPDAGGPAGFSASNGLQGTSG